MSCGNLILQDPLGRFWVMSAGNNGQLINALTPLVMTNYTPPVITSPSYYWQLSSLSNGTITATPVSPTSASSSYQLTTLSGFGFMLTMEDDGVLYTTGQIGQVFISVPYPTNVSMSKWPNLGLISSVAGATPLTVSADFSIWSCTLNRFVNEDTTNLVVVLSE